MPAREAPAARVMHGCRGRTRLGFPGQRGKPAFFRDMAHVVAALPGVVRAEGRPATGSLIVEHAGDSAEFLDLAGAAGAFAIETQHMDGPAGLLGPALTRLQAAGLPGLDEFGLKHASAMVFVGMAVQQALRGNLMPPAATALWYAFSLLSSRQPEGPTQGESGDA